MKIETRVVTPQMATEWLQTIDDSACSKGDAAEACVSYHAACWDCARRDTCKQEPVTQDDGETLVAGTCPRTPLSGLKSEI